MKPERRKTARHESGQAMAWIVGAIVVALIVLIVVFAIRPGGGDESTAVEDVANEAQETTEGIVEGAETAIGELTPDPESQDDAADDAVAADGEAVAEADGADDADAPADEGEPAGEQEQAAEADDAAAEEAPEVQTEVEGEAEPVAGDTPAEQAEADAQAADQAEQQATEEVTTVTESDLEDQQAAQDREITAGGGAAGDGDQGDQSARQQEAGRQATVDTTAQEVRMRIDRVRAEASAGASASELQSELESLARGIDGALERAGDSSREALQSARDAVTGLMEELESGEVESTEIGDRLQQFGERLSLESTE